MNSVLEHSEAQVSPINKTTSNTHTFVSTTNSNPCQNELSFPTSQQHHSVSSVEVTCPVKKNMMNNIMLECAKAIDEYDVDTLYQQMEQAKSNDILISNLKTDDGLTLLHLAALKNMQICLNEIVLFFKTQ